MSVSEGRRNGTPGANCGAFGKWGYEPRRGPQCGPRCEPQDEPRSEPQNRVQAEALSRQPFQGLSILLDLLPEPLLEALVGVKKGDVPVDCFSDYLRGRDRADSSDAVQIGEHLRQESER